MEVARRRQSWSHWVCLPPPDSVLVATNGVDGRVAAYCAIGAVREPEDGHPTLPTGELMSIYADPVVWGHGAGHAVHRAALAALAGFRFRHAVLWVFEENARARAFYQRQGWRYDGVRKELEIGDDRPLEVRYSTSL
jgi:RimJ/RimL family protein N-acetyltransferase